MDVVQIIDSVSTWPVSVTNTTSSRSVSMHAKLGVCIHMDDCIDMDDCTEEFVSL